jgi:hypothetical protein
MIHTILVGAGFTIGAILVLWIINRSVGPTVADLFKVAVLLAIIAAIPVALIWPPAIVMQVIAVMAWAFFWREAERYSDPRWANVLAFGFAPHCSSAWVLFWQRFAEGADGEGASAAWNQHREVTVMLDLLGEQWGVDADTEQRG